MKKLTTGIVLLIAILFTCNNVKSQTLKDNGDYYRVTKPYDDKKITALFNIYVNDKRVSNEDYVFEFINKEKKIDIIHMMSEGFTVFLDYGQTYTFKIGHKNYNYKTIEIETKAPKSIWVVECNIYLYSNEPNEYAGKLVYSKMDNKFKKI